MAKQGLVAGVCAFALILHAAGLARAGDARIVEDAGPDRLVVETSDSTVDEILKVLSQRFGFSVERATRSGEPVRFSGRLRGSLDGLLERVLRHDGHIIVRSVEAKSGISRVVILDAKGGGAPTVVAAGPAAQQPPAKDTPPAAAGTQKPADQPFSQPVASSQPPAVVDSTLAQLEQIGRQVAGLGAYQPTAPGAAALPATSAPSSGAGTGVEADAQRLTQQAAGNVQALVTSLRAICLGPSCNTPR